MVHRAYIATWMALIVLLSAVAPAPAKVQLQVDVGWDNFYRPGRWTPVFVTATESAPRQVLLEIYAPTDRRYAMTILQGLAIGPTSVTVPIYVPLSYAVDETTVSVRDANTNRRLETTPLADQAIYMRGAQGPQAVAETSLFVGLSGSSSTARLIASQMSGQQNISVGALPQARLPAVATGYDAIDVLILNQPDLNRISLDQQSAIVEWVRAGGLLVMWPGVEPIPALGPIQDVLPARLGATMTYSIPPQQLQTAGLPARFAQLKGRAIDAVAEDAKPVNIFGDALVAHRRWVGMGQVLLIPADVSSFVFSDGSKGLQFWRNVLRDLVTIPDDDPNARNNYYYYGINDDPRRIQATRQAMDWIAGIPGAGSFGFSYVAIVLIAMMLIVGPVDWFVLKWIGRQPWTWATITGWIGLITLGAIYIGHVFKSGDLHFRTVSMIDEAGGMRVTATDLAGLYSPRTRAYEFDFDPRTWWRAASDQNYFGGGGLRIDIKYHQDYRGNRPLPMLVNVWNTRFLEGTDHSQAPAMLSAKLNITHHETLTGTVTNQSDSAIKLVAIRTSRGVLHLDREIPAGGSLPVTGKLRERDNEFASTRPSSQNPWQYYNQPAPPATRPHVQGMVELSPARSDRIERALKERSDLAVLYAEFASPSPRVTLKDETAKREHFGFVRAVVTLEN